MEYIDGDDAGRAAARRAARSPCRRRARSPSQFLAGLEAIHRAGLVHRDFKPENVMISRAGRVVVMDFGLAQCVADTPAPTVSGTPAYMAPEQARGERGRCPRGRLCGRRGARRDAGGRRAATVEARRGESGAAVRETPPRLPDAPWASVLRGRSRPTATSALPRRARLPAPSRRSPSAIPDWRTGIRIRVWRLSASATPSTSSGASWRSRRSGRS